MGTGKAQGDGGEFNHRDLRASLTGKYIQQMVPFEEEAPDFRNVAGQACPGLSASGPVVT